MKLTKKGKITHTVTLSGKDIIDMLHEMGTDYTPGADATAEFKVPGGGDYSNTEVDFLNEERVVITWTKAKGDEEWGSRVGTEKGHGGGRRKSTRTASSRRLSGLTPRRRRSFIALARRWSPTARGTGRLRRRHSAMLSVSSTSVRSP